MTCDHVNPPAWEVPATCDCTLCAANPTQAVLDSLSHVRLFLALEALETDSASKFLVAAAGAGLEALGFGTGPPAAHPVDDKDVEQRARQLDMIAQGTVGSPVWLWVADMETRVHATFRRDETLTGKTHYVMNQVGVDGMNLQVRSLDGRGPFVGFEAPSHEYQEFQVNPCECVFREVKVVRVTRRMRSLYMAFVRAMHGSA